MIKDGSEIYESDVFLEIKVSYFSNEIFKITRFCGNIFLLKTLEINTFGNEADFDEFVSGEGKFCYPKSVPKKSLWSKTRLG